MLISTISDFQPDLIGFACLFSGNFPEVLKLSLLCKKPFENVPIAAGGTISLFTPNQILKNCHSIDWIFLGEAEQSIIQLVNTVKTKRYDFDSIDGFAYRKNGKVVMNSMNKEWYTYE